MKPRPLRPMSYEAREDAYSRQNSENGDRPLTVRQRRQLRKTEKRAIYRPVR